MELNQLEYFRTLASIRHFTKTAQAINMSQSALSRSITRLEQELGTPLFIRDTKNIRLTPQGQRFLTHVERALRELDKGKQEIEDENAPDHGVINLSFIHSLGSYFLPQLLSEFRLRYPHIAFNLDQNNSAVLAKRLIAGKSDISLCSTMVNMEQIAWLYLYTEELFAALPKNHPFSHRKSLELKDLEGEPFITLKPNYSLRILTDQYCALSGIHPSIIFEGDDINTAASLVAANLGISLLPKLTGVDASDLIYVPISFPICKREIGLAWCSTRPLPPAAHKFQQFIINTFAKKTRLSK